MISFRQLKGISFFKIKGGFIFTFFGDQEPRIRNQVPGKRENRKMAVKGNVNQITLLWGSASNHN